jgi:hypothetical protein
MAFYIFHIKNEIGGTIVYNYPLVFPLIAVILTYLGFRGIRKDELLVRSYERIR